MTDSETILLRLRNAAKAEPNSDNREHLKWNADLLQAALRELNDQPTTEAMLLVNGTWAYAERLLKTAGAGNGGSNSGGAMPEGARLAA